MYVVSQTDDSFLAMARARALLPDVLVIDLGARSAGDAATVIDQARQLRPPSHILVHSGDTLGLGHALAQLAGDAAPPA